MDTLKPNMYARTLNGIVKIDEIKDGFMIDTKGHIHYGDFIKASFDIIDILEVGDYVNGFPVIHKENDILKCGLLVQFKENDIKSIVTKEQFSQMEYRIGE